MSHLAEEIRAEKSREAGENILDQLTADRIAGIPQVELGCMADLAPEPIEWLWKGWLAVGKLHMLAGAAGTGKTTIALDLAATLTRGGTWPDGTSAPTGEVLIWSGEDGLEDTVVPRLAAAHADRSRLRYVKHVTQFLAERQFDPAKHMAALADELERRPDIRLVIIDPIVSMVTVDSNNNAEVRRSLQPVVDLAGRARCAVIGISHFTKGSAARTPLERVTGSLAFGALPRIVMVTCRRSDGEPGTEDHLLVRAKSNIGPSGGGFSYSTAQIDLPENPDVSTSRISWGNAVKGDAGDLVARAESTSDVARANGPTSFLEEFLDAGPKAANEVFSEAEARGFSKRQIRTAAETLGVHKRKDGMTGGWFWSLEEDGVTPEDAEDPPPESAAPSSSSAPTAELTEYPTD